MSSRRRRSRIRRATRRAKRAARRVVTFVKQTARRRRRRSTPPAGFGGFPMARRRRSTSSRRRSSPKRRRYASRAGFISKDTLLTTAGATTGLVGVGPGVNWAIGQINKDAAGNPQEAHPVVHAVSVAGVGLGLGYVARKVNKPFGNGLAVGSAAVGVATIGMFFWDKIKESQKKNAGGVKGLRGSGEAWQAA